MARWLGAPRSAAPRGARVELVPDRIRRRRRCPRTAHAFLARLGFECAVHTAVVVRQRKSWRRKDGVYIFFEDNAGVIVNNKGEMKGASGRRARRARLG